MSSRDFLHKDAQTPLCEHYIAAGAIFRFSTNSEELLAAARETFVRLTATPAAFDFSIRIWIEGPEGERPPWPKPYVRGLDHLVFAGFDGVSSLLADLRSHRVIGRFSRSMAADIEYWKTIIFPMLMSIVAGSAGLAEIHASCVAAGEKGLILIGPTGSGKSTLALAFTEAGFRFLSDDRIFCSFKQDKLLAWGMPRPLKLRREAARWFEKFRDREPSGMQDGEPVFHCYPNLRFGSEGMRACVPQALVFLDRQHNSGYCLSGISTAEARRKIELDLLAESSGAIQKQAEIMEHLTALPCCRLSYGGRPQAIVDRLISDFPTLISDLSTRLHGEPREAPAAG